MGLNKKDRRISIWIGVLIGITLSSMLFRYAINDKNERASTRKGSYQSGVTAISGLPCPPIPEILKKTIPQGIVIHYEANQSVSDFEKSYQTDCWVIESSGAIRSERLFILAEIKKGKDIAFYRASELYLTAEDGVDETTLSEQLPTDKFRILGQNSKTSEFILQVKEISPKAILNNLKELPLQFSNVKKVRLYPWYGTN
ncbi:MAG: hypothetical protein VXZ32_02765 [Verrucomicrobiota bacterium]|nr:hypothetical protein [Verrucomicrobiota bacterium]